MVRMGSTGNRVYAVFGDGGLVMGLEMEMEMEMARRDGIHCFTCCFIFLTDTLNMSSLDVDTYRDGGESDVESGASDVGEDQPVYITITIPIIDSVTDIITIAISSAVSIPHLHLHPHSHLYQNTVYLAKSLPSNIYLLLSPPSKSPSAIIFPNHCRCHHPLYHRHHHRHHHHHPHRHLHPAIRPRHQTCRLLQ